MNRAAPWLIFAAQTVVCLAGLAALLLILIMLSPVT